MFRKMVRYLITSGNSKTGRATIQSLKARGESDIVAGARDPIKSEAELKRAGASKVVEFDFTKPATISKALEGVERVLICHGSPDITNFPIFAQNVVNATKQPGSTVRTLVNLSGYLTDVNATLPAGRQLGRAFEVIKNSGLQHISVGPSYFFENWIEQKDLIKSGTVYGASNNKNVGYIAATDIGDAVAAIITSPDKFNGKHVTFSGQTIKEADIIKVISDAIGIPVKYVNLSNAEYIETLRNFGLPEQLIQLQADFELDKAKGDFVDTSDPQLKDLIGRAPITVEQWVKENAALFK